MTNKQNNNGRAMPIFNSNNPKRFLCTNTFSIQAILSYYIEHVLTRDAHDGQNKHSTSQITVIRIKEHIFNHNASIASQSPTLCHSLPKVTIPSFLINLHSSFLFLFAFRVWNCMLGYNWEKVRSPCIPQPFENQGSIRFQFLSPQIE